MNDDSIGYAVNVWAIILLICGIVFAIFFGVTTYIDGFEYNIGSTLNEVVDYKQELNNFKKQAIQYGYAEWKEKRDDSTVPPTIVLEFKWKDQ